MSTIEAFEKMLSYNTQDVCRKLKISDNTFYSLKHRFRQRKLISDENMREMLLKFGFKLVQDISWKEPI